LLALQWLELGAQHSNSSVCGRTMSTLHVKATARMLGARSLRGTTARRCIMRLRHASAVRGLYWLYISWARLGTTAKPTPSPIAALVFPPSLFLEAVDRVPAGRTSRSAATHATASTCHSCMSARSYRATAACPTSGVEACAPAAFVLCPPSPLSHLILSYLNSPNDAPGAQTDRDRAPQRAQREHRATYIREVEH
jgi:hypothetical protein